MVLQTKYDVLFPKNDQQRHYFSELSNVHHTQSQNKLFFRLSVLVTHSAHLPCTVFFFFLTMLAHEYILFPRTIINFEYEWF